ncbi:MAG: AAA family ATPase [Nitrospirota bacterium]
MTEFRRAMEQAGIPPPVEMIGDGKIHRFRTNGKATKNGWYILFDDGLPAGSFGDWALGVKETWSGRHETTMTAEEQAAHRQRLEAIKRQRDAEEKRRHGEAAVRAQTLWDAAPPATDDHPYLHRKHVKPHGVRASEGRLVVPMRDAGGALHSLQFIDDTGGKQFLVGGRVKGCFFLIGDLVDILCLAEGFATGASIHEATGHAVAVAFSAGSLKAVAQALRAKYPQVGIIVAGDNDASGTGQKAAREAAEAVGGALAIPAEAGDWNDFSASEGPEALREVVDQARNTILAYRPHPLPETNFAPILASDLLAETPELTHWILEDFFPVGSLALLAGKPKEGKTTLTYEAAVNIAQGRPFLGRTTTKCGVLILAVEEHRRDVQLRLHALGAANLDNLHLSIGPLSPSPTLFSDMRAFVKDKGIKLIIIDTLAAFWRVENENDASEMTRAVKPLLHLARDSGACVLLIHHARKSEGSHGDEIRGSGALFSLVDVALVMKRHSVENQRLLQAQSRYPETPSELVLELREAGYVALGDPASIGKAAKLEKLISILSDDWEDGEAVAKRAGLSRRDGSRLLGILVEQGKANRNGKGRKADPYTYRRSSFLAGPPVYRPETNSEQANSFLAGPQPLHSPARNESGVTGVTQDRGSQLGAYDEDGRDLAPPPQETATSATEDQERQIDAYHEEVDLDA